MIGLCKNWQMREAIRIAKSKHMTDAQIAAVRKSFPDLAVKLLSKPFSEGGISGMGDHHAFMLYGMYVGVEFDGHIHT